MSDRGSPAPRRRRNSLDPMDERETDDRRPHRSSRDKERRRRASPLDSEEEERRVRKEDRRQRSPADARIKYARDRSRDRSTDRRKRKERSLSREGGRADDRVKRRDDYERRRHDRDDNDDRKRSSRHGRHDDGEDRRQPTRRRRSYSRSKSPPSRREHRSKQSPSPSGSRRLTTRSHSPPPKRRRRSPSRSASRSPPRKSRSSPHRKARGPLASQEDSFRGGGDSSAVVLDKDGKPIEKQKPNFNATGLLAREANTVAGTNTVLKYHEPSEARKPPSKQQWRIYVFKGDDIIDTIHIYTRSCWLMGRDEKICDYHIQHPSASKQHAVVQFRYITKTNEFGEREGKVKPYFVDLESANGSKVDGKKVDAGRYVELFDGDVLSFGESDRQYVMMLPPP